MGSIRTLENIFIFTEYAYAWKVLPFYVTRKPYYKIVFEPSTKYKVATVFSIVTDAVFLLLLAKEVVQLDQALTSMEDLLLLLAVGSIYATCLGTQIWILVKLYSFVSIANSFLQFNLFLCKRHNTLGQSVICLLG